MADLNEHIRKVYFTEIRSQCGYAMNAILGLNSVITRLPDAIREGDHEKSIMLQREVFRSIHSFLTHTSNVSRLLWPAPPGKQKGESPTNYVSRCAADPGFARGRDLRNVLGLPEHGHVLHNRQLRDHLEHFDERLDDWQATSKHHNYVQDSIGSFGSIAGSDPGDMMRWFDPSTNHFHFRGEKYDLQSVVNGIVDIQTRVGPL